jgi:hypothetical protein
MIDCIDTDSIKQCTLHVSFLNGINQSQHDIFPQDTLEPQKTRNPNKTQSPRNIPKPYPYNKNIANLNLHPLHKYGSSLVFTAQVSNLQYHSTQDPRKAPLLNKSQIQKQTNLRSMQRIKGAKKTDHWTRIPKPEENHETNAPKQR